MPPKPFYEINPKAYLFGKTEDKPEERVRQWVLFELMSTYGIAINNIHIELPVKAGRTSIFADIVITRNGAPYAVIECKKWNDRKKKQGMKQAISYADASTMKARYAVFTNGDVWEVKRKIGDHWIDIPDLPKRVDSSNFVGIDDLVRSINDFTPAFYWLNQAVPATSAKAYFSCLQALFNGSTYPLNYLERDLRFGTDLLLRVISNNGSHPDSIRKNMACACRSFYAFFERRLGQKVMHDLNKDDIWQLTADASTKFNDLVDDTRELEGQEFKHIRFITILLHYLMKQVRQRDEREFFDDVPATLTREFQDLVSFLFQVHLGVSFPDPVLEESCTDLRSFCCSDWERFKRESDGAGG